MNVKTPNTQDKNINKGERVIGIGNLSRKVFLVTCAILVAATCGQVYAARPDTFHDDVQVVIVHADPVILIDNVRIINGTGAPAREKASLLIENGRIAAIMDAGKIESSTAVRIDAEGKTLLPGFIMMHEHLIYLDPTGSLPSYTSEPLPMPPLYLAAGTTTMRTGGTMNASDDLQVKQMINQGRLAGPDEQCVDHVR